MVGLDKARYKSLAQHSEALALSQGEDKKKREDGKKKTDTGGDKSAFTRCKNAKGRNEAAISYYNK